MAKRKRSQSRKMKLVKYPRNVHSAANTMVEGIVDVTKIGMTGAVGIGMIGAASNLFKQS